MQELEKILEEIKAEAAFYMRTMSGYRAMCVPIGAVESIIRKRMNDGIEVTEYCPHCDREVTVQWDVNEDGYQIYCPNCGKIIMLCSMCDARDGAICDWTKKGCKHSGKRYSMNDGWIPVDERLPEKNEYFVETSSDKDFPNGYYKRLEVAYMTDIIEYVHGYYDGYKWMDKYLDTIENVVAWRIHEPYRPERTKP